MTTEQAKLEFDKDELEDYVSNLEARKEMERD